MPVISLTEQQVVELLKQLSPGEQETALRYLLRQWWPGWSALSASGQERIRALAVEHGLDWDTLDEQQREAFVAELLHDDR